MAFTVYAIHTGINDEQQQALNYKLQRLTQWANTLDITLDIQLLNEKTLTTDPLPADQLEQLYLNGLMLAGASPFWWFVPLVKITSKLKDNTHNKEHKSTTI